MSTKTRPAKPACPIAFPRPASTRVSSAPTDAGPAHPGSRVLASLVPLLFLSGSCALVFQVAWMREFRLVFGASTAASAAVVAIFMGGLGLGNAVFGSRADRHRNPLALYARLELGIAMTASASPLAIDAIRWIYVTMGGQEALGLGPATAIRLLLALLVLGVPTVLMGGTLPAVSRAGTPSHDRQRRVVALLYGSNTLGSVLGAVAGTFVLLPQLGTRISLWTMCCVNVAVAVAAWLLSRRFREKGAEAALLRPRTAETPRVKQLAGEVADDGVPRAAIYAAAALVGFAFFLMELAWYRMLGPILGGTTFTFGLILAVALTGIGLGGAVYPWFFRRRQPTVGGLSLTCGLEAACIALPYAIGDDLALWSEGLRQSSGGFVESVAGWAVIAGAAILPAALVSGIQFPMLISLLGQADRRVGREVGMVAAINTVGAILGSLAGGFGVLPLLGAPGTWRAVVILLSILSVGLFLLSMRRKEIRTPLALMPLLATVVAVVCVIPEGPTAVWRHSGIGAGRAGVPLRSPNERQEWMHACRRRLLWETDGVEASIGLLADNGLAFCINGKTDGNAVLDVGTQTMLGVVGAVLHRDPKSALVVGMGSGETAGWLAQVPSMGRIDVVELEPAIDEVARRCAEVNHNVLEDPKVRRIYNDAREVVLTSAEQFDLIVSEPSNPYRAGIASLFTREFYAACKDRLAEAGLMVQWLQGYEVDDRTVATVFATLRSVFAHVEVWHSQKGDMLLVCADRPIDYRVADLRRRIARDPYRSALAVAWRAVDLEGVLSRYVAGTEAVDGWSRRFGGELNTDDHNRVEYGFARTVGNRASGFSIDTLRGLAVEVGDYRPAVAQGEVGWDRVEDHRQVNHALAASEARLPSNATSIQKARAEVLRRYFQRDTRAMTAAWESASYEPLFPTEVALLAIGYAHQGNEKAMAMIDRLRSFHPGEAWGLQAFLRLRQGKHAEAADAAEKAFGDLRTNPWMLSHVGELLFDAAEAAAQSDRRQAARLCAAVASPFAVFAWEERRFVAAYGIARLLGPPAAIEVLACYEPNVPWTQRFLQERCEFYQSAGHPLADKAGRDLNRFRRQAVR